MSASRQVVAGAGGWLQRHRPGATALLWSGSVALLVADILAADLVPGPTDLWHAVAAGLAIFAVVLFVTAALIGLRHLVQAQSRNAWIRKHRPGPPCVMDDEVIAREAARGINALEVFLARQKHTH
jgi:hypothetical protein